ncbi:IS256 family transposase [Patulibacter defluvii]|uniref:IS256 family transposase n=1 Tax=Patulibacter defluvii TaxID=3095358 RepID=UPI002A75E596|nr:IS256 family transposase [Patulibacter sp. DM4]
MARSEGTAAARSAAEELLSSHGDVVRESVAFMVGELIEAEVSRLIEAELGERSEGRVTHRNGYRHRAWDTRAGQVDVAIPKLRQGSYFPSFLEPRKRHEQALVAVVQEAYVNGVSTRKVDRLVEQMGLSLSKDQVSRMCQGLDEQVQAFRTRPLAGRFPYLWLDAKIEKVRHQGTVRQKALVVAYAVNQDGQREVLGLDVGEAETEAFWTEFLHDLRARGLSGVQLVISDARQGLRNAIGRVIGARWQRCTVHFLRDMLGHVSRAQQPAVATAIRQVFNSENGLEARERLGEVVDRLSGPAPKVARLLADAEEDLLGYYEMPPEHWRKLRSTNPLERLNKEIARRSDVVGIYPNDQALIRLAGMVLIEQHEEWPIGRRYLSELSMRRIPDHPEVDTTLTLEVAA